MEATGTAEGLLETIRPPRLEEAGLEDCSLPPDSIKEAFLKAATAVKSRAASILSPSGEAELDGDYVNDPWPSAGESSDTLVGITLETEPKGACPVEKGGGVPDAASVDDVTTGVIDREESGDKVVGTDVPDEGEACVDGLQGLKIGDKGKKLKNDVEDEEEGERPILAEAYV
ncbi:hypothetical protein LguiA_028669 [Lonicera macranthoides]